MIDNPQYVDEPLAYLAVKNSDIAEYISPNAASLIVSQIYQYIKLYLKYISSTNLTLLNLSHQMMPLLLWVKYFNISQYISNYIPNISCQQIWDCRIYLTKWCFSYCEWVKYISNQAGLICGTIVESSRSLKAFVERISISFCNKKAVFTNFCDENAVFRNTWQKLLLTIANLFQR